MTRGKSVELWEVESPGVEEVSDNSYDRYVLDSWSLFNMSKSGDYNLEPDPRSSESLLIEDSNDKFSDLFCVGPQLMYLVGLSTND